MSPLCLHWYFVEGSRDVDPCYQLYAQRGPKDDRLVNTGYIIQDRSAYTEDPEPFMIYKPQKSSLIGEPKVKAIDKAVDIYQASVVAVLHATGRTK
jgi:hypothetical protein